MKHQLYIGLGSNLGDRESLIREALRLVELNIGPIVRTSGFIETEPLGFQSEHLFLNAVALVVTTLAPHQCLTATQRIERMLGRKQKSKGGVYHDRPIDIDLLIYDNLHITTPELTLPHPHIGERPFVKLPLREIMDEESRLNSEISAENFVVR